MNHVLDNPIWHALISGNRNMSVSTELVKYFPKEIATFAGLKEVNQSSLKLLYDMISPERTVILITAESIEIPASWNIIYQSIILQMVSKNPKKPGLPHEEIVHLNKMHVPQMLALTILTNPGPFFERTIEFGNYTGIFKSGELIAMAGQRLHVNQYVEISAVCTHPDHVGKGYGSMLIQHQAQQIVQKGNIPFLHSRSDNDQAIRLYKALGFTTRQEMNLNVIQK
jgi:predicted GNAT family acetyltransferase